MPRFGIKASVDVALESDRTEGVMVLLEKAVFEVSAERKRKSCVSSERSTSIGFEVMEWVSELGFVCAKEGSSSSKSAMLSD